MKYPFRIDTVKNESFAMDCAIFGSGKKSLVILPGISLHSVTESAVAAARNFELFEDEYTVYLFDRVKDMPEKYSVETMADDTSAAMRMLGIKDAYLFGASQGGMITLCIAEKYPELVRKAAVASTMLRNNPDSYAFFLRIKELAVSGKKEELNREFFRGVYSDAYLKKYEKAFKRLEAEGTDEELRRMAVMLDACLDFDISDRIENIKCPFLVAGDENDRIMTGFAEHELSAALNCELIMYSSYGHAVYDEAPDFKQKLYDFFNK